MSGSKGSVRIGPISLFTLVIVLCLAVMAVLAVTTAQATHAAAEKQALFTDDTYANERAAQALVAEIDGALADVRKDGGDLDAALAAVERVLPEGAEIEGTAVSAEFARPSGRTLLIELSVRANATYEITSWKATTNWTDAGPGEKLWPGPANTR